MNGLLGGGRLLGVEPVQAGHLVLDPHHRLLGGHAAVADGGVQLVQGAEAHLLEDEGEHVLGGDGGQGEAHVLELRLEGGAAGGDVLLPPLLLEPLADLVAGLVGLADLHPVPAGAMGRLGGDNLHNVAVFQRGVEGDHAAVDLGPGHVVAHGGVDVVGEVDGGGPGGQVDHVPAGGEDEHLVGEEIHPHGAHELLGVHVLLALQQLAHPLEGLLGAQLGVGHALLVLPVGGDAVLGGVVHLPGADLHLEGDALPADDGGVEGLVAVGLGGGDIVLEPAQHGVEQVVDDAQDIVALGHVVDDDPEGIEVEDLVHGLVLGIHLAVDGVDMLHPAVDGAADALLVQPVLDALLDARQKLLMGGGAGGQLVGNLPVADGIQVLQGGVLQLPLDALHAQAVGDGRIDLHGFQGLLLLLAGALVLHGAHVVQPVADFDEDHPDVLGHGHEHLAQVLHLLLFLGGVLHPGQLGDPLHQIGHRGAEELGDLLVGGPGVLDAVVEQGGDDGVGIQLQLRHNLRHCQGVGDIGGAILAQLSGVGVVGVGERAEQALGVQRRVVFLDFILQRLIALQDGVHTSHLT